MTDDQCGFVDERGRRCLAADMHVGDVHVFADTTVAGYRVHNRRAEQAEQALAEQRSVTEQATRLAAQRADEAARLRGLLRQVRQEVGTVTDEETGFISEDQAAAFAAGYNEIAESVARLIDDSRLLEEQP